MGSHGTMVASGEGFASLNEDKEAEKMVSDLLQPPGYECQPSLSLPLPPRGPEPWALPSAAATHANVEQRDGIPSAKSVGYREQLRSRGNALMQGSYLWKPFAETALTAESQCWSSVNDRLSVTQALGLTWSDACATTYPVPPAAHSPFYDTVTPTFSGHFPMQPPMPSMARTPTVAFENGVDQLLAIAMPGFLGGLSSVQIEQQLRAAASQIEVYDD